ncbi:MAG: radical SAM protein [Collinsella sp.]
MCASMPLATQARSSIRTVYVGGGTPSLAGERLVELARRISAWCKPVEFTCEANPESLTSQLAAALAGVGVTRISLGVQTLDNAELVAIGRIHDADRALAAITTVKDAGLDVSRPVASRADYGELAVRSMARLQRPAPCVGLSAHARRAPLYRMACRDESLEPDEDFQAASMDVAASG